MNSMKKPINPIIPRTVLFLILLLTIYVLTATINFPSMLGIGEIRVLFVGFSARICEDLLFSAIRKTQI